MTSEKLHLATLYQFAKFCYDMMMFD